MRPDTPDFRFEFWPWQFLGRKCSQAALSGFVAAENCRFCSFWEITGSTGVKSEGPGTGRLAWIPMEGKPANIQGRILGEKPGFFAFSGWIWLCSRES